MKTRSISNLRPLLRASSQTGKSNLLRNLFALLVIPAGVGMFLDGPLAKAQNAYIANFSGNTVSVIATATNSVTATIAVGSGPFGVAVTPNGSKVYVVNGGDDTVSVIDTARNRVIGSPIIVGSGPSGVAVTPDGSRVYVANQQHNTVSVIDTVTNTVTGSPIPVGVGPLGVAITPDGSNVYVANRGINMRQPGNTVSVIDTATNTVIGSPITVGQGPTGLAVTPDGRKVYVVNGGDDTVSVIDTATNMVTGSPISVGGLPQWVAVTPDGSAVYVTNFQSNTVSAIHTATNSVTATIAVGQNPAAFGIFIQPMIPFAAFSAELRSPIFFPSSQLTGAFTLAAESHGINPVKENVILQIGTFSFHIPPGSFIRELNGTFFFTGTIDQVTIAAQIVPLGNKGFSYSFTGAVLDSDPRKVKVGLTIGIDTGTTRVRVPF